MPKLLIDTRTLTEDEHKVLIDTGYYLRWLAHLGPNQDVFEIYTDRMEDKCVV